METDEIYQLIKGRHKELADGFRAMARGAELLASMLDSLAAMPEPEPIEREPSSETEPCPPPDCPCAVDCILVENHDGPCVDGSGSDIATAPIGSPPEMAVHAPSTVPPTLADVDASIAAVSAASDAVAESLDNTAATAGELSAAVNTSTKRAKNEYTAKEWGHSSHFLAYMKKAPFAAWTAEQQNAKRDEFVAATPPDLKMNRWGERFAKFCGVAS